MQTLMNEFVAIGIKEAQLTIVQSCRTQSIRLIMEFLEQELSKFEKQKTLSMGKSPAKSSEKSAAKPSIDKSPAKSSGKSQAKPTEGSLAKPSPPEEKGESSKPAPTPAPSAPKPQPAVEQQPQNPPSALSLRTPSMPPMLVSPTASEVSGTESHVKAGKTEFNSNWISHIPFQQKKGI